MMRPRRVRSGIWPIDQTVRYDAVCDTCGWSCHVTPHKAAAVAERCLTRHVLSKHMKGGAQ